MRRALIVLSLITIVITVAPACAGNCADPNGDSKVNVGDVVYLINYIFKNGPAPDCGSGTILRVCGDVNVDVRVNVGDAVYLINYIFKSGPGPDCGPETGTVTDIDGNTYLTAKIGDQWWMAENLEVTHYRNGDAIPNIIDGNTWYSLTTEAYCEFDNDIINVTTYGRLYNWYAVTDDRNIAPVGWHVPTDVEWQTLIDYLGGDAIAGGKMKEAGTTHWSSPNTGATNESGFSSLPAGYRGYIGNYIDLGGYTAYWSSTEYGNSYAKNRALTYYIAGVSPNFGGKFNGFSVRCIKGDSEFKVPELTTAEVGGITQTTAQCGGIITFDGGATVNARGVCWSTNPIPTVTDNKTADGAGAGSFASSITGLTGNTIYYVRAYATNSVGTGYGNIIAFSTDPGPITDIDGNAYQTVKIGYQWWMSENLRVTHYRNGEAIPNVTDNATWAGLTTGACSEYNNDVNNVAAYGRLYNWHAVNDSRNIAPSGWHVPSDAEWKQLEMYLGMSQVDADGTAWRGTNEGGKLKEAGSTHWLSPNTGATNESGFFGVPNGSRYPNGNFGDMGGSAPFWSSTESSGGNAWLRSLYYLYSQTDRSCYSRCNGFAVRCVRDYTGIVLPVLTTADVSAITPTTAQCGGTIISDGGAIVAARGVCWSTNSSPTVTDNKTIDGTGIGGFASSIVGLLPNTTYYVRAYATNSAGTGYGSNQPFTTGSIWGTVTDIDGNVYRTVIISAQVWMADNLKVTHYRDGSAIPKISNGTTWYWDTTGAYCEYNNDANNVPIYGRLYNWLAVHNSHNIAPAGWHVPSDGEWQTLIDYLGGDAPAGGKMKETGTIHWISPNGGATNESGFSGVPGGERTDIGSYYSMGYEARYWSSTQWDIYYGGYLGLYYLYSNAGRSYEHRSYGYSIRCVKD